MGWCGCVDQSACALRPRDAIGATRRGVALSRRALCHTANPNPKSGFGDGKGARERAIRHRHHAGTMWDGVGAWTSWHARRDREMRLVRLASWRPPHAALCHTHYTANSNPKSGFGDGKGARERATRRFG